MICKSGGQVAPAGASYRRREPEKGTLHRVLAEHLETFLDRANPGGMGPHLPRFVERELRSYLKCGLLCHGFARVRCTGCGHDLLVAFSCKGRGFCPSCGGRRMAETAAKLVDRVIPEVPVRQWVLSMPWRLRFLLASDPQLCQVVRRSFLRAVFRFYRALLAREGIPSGHTGAVNVVQRFGSALNLNVHFHALVLDGVYTKAGPFDPPVFHPAPAIDQQDIIRLLAAIQTNIMRLLRKRGLWPEPGEAHVQDEAQTDSLFPVLAAASIQGRVALGPNAGKRVERAGDEPTGADPFDAGAGSLCADQDGFSLHAEVHVEGHDRTRLEHLCRYVACGPIASERLSLSPEGKVIYELRRAWRDGTTRIVFDPLTFIERLAALVPRPRVHLVTYHGVLAPASAWRDMIVPSSPALPDEPGSLPDQPQGSLREGQEPPSNTPALPAAAGSTGPDFSNHAAANPQPA